MVEESFAQLVLGLKAQIEGAGTIVSAATDDLLNHPTRGVGASLQVWKTNVESLMDATFNRIARPVPSAGWIRSSKRPDRPSSRQHEACSTLMPRTPPWPG